MPADDHYIESASLSEAWLQAMRLSVDRHEIVPLVLNVTGFEHGRPVEDLRVREELDRKLLAFGKQTCRTVANTIFPDSLWNPSRARSRLFERYLRIYPRIRSHNRFGTYFERLITGGPSSNRNQLDFAIETYTARSGVRRSVLQLSVFDGARDHTTAALRGFPCLQHVTFAPYSSGLAVNGFYANQYMIERAYGNYLGLCDLGRFVAHELGLPLSRMTCFTGIAIRDINVGDLRRLISSIERVTSMA